MKQHRTHVDEEHESVDHLLLYAIEQSWIHQAILEHNLHSNEQIGECAGLYETKCSGSPQVVTSVGVVKK